VRISKRAGWQSGWATTAAGAKVQTTHAATRAIVWAQSAETVVECGLGIECAL
jgi:hypothetical protein